MGAQHHFYLESSHDSHRIGIHHWACASNPAKGVVLWLHGMAEHGARYQPLAEALTQAGWHLYCPDHRGHGTSITDAAPKGHFDDRNGWNKVQADIDAVLDYLQRQHAALPLVLGGHSMGSFIALGAAQRHAGRLSGLVLCGSGYHSSFYYRLIRLAVMLERYRHGQRGISPLIHKLTFGSWAKQVEQPETEFDWLSADSGSVARYREDPLCGFDCTTGTWLDLVTALRQIHSRPALTSLPQTLPLLLLAGEQDPMSDHGKGVHSLEKALRKAGVQVDARYWPQGRHEILNDLCADEVRGALLAWLEDKNTGAG